VKPDPYAWYPFGGGARRCLGIAFALLEMRVVIAEVVRSVELRKARPEPADVKRRGFTLVPKGGTEVIVRERLQRDASAAQPAAATPARDAMAAGR